MFEQVGPGTGTTQYSYVPVGSLGALQLQQESGPLANGAIAYAYDELGRLASRTVGGQGAETFQYDALGRLVTHASDLGSFTLSYLGQTGQLISRTLSGSTLATTWSYLPNSGDRRLSGIANTGLAAGQYSNYAFTTTPENFISGITESSDASAVYPTAGTQTATYNNLNQLTNLSGQTLTFDADGSLTSDGQRTYSWDAENRLVGIAYPGQPGKATAFTYDGLGRRVSIASTPPGGGSATTTSYLWCGSALCQARDAGNTPIRGYYDEGEVVPGSPAQPYYYGLDQIGSVRRAFASTSSAPAYSYDPYGVPLQGTAPVTDFVYGGMFYNADSGLYLTRYRAYDPVAGRWLSRDPFGEGSDPVGNLYPYAGGNPISLTDPNGDFVPLLVGAAAGAASDVAIQLAINGGKFGCINWGSVGISAALGAVGGAGGGYVDMLFRRAFAALAARRAAQTAAQALGEASTTIGARGGESAAAAAGRQAHRELAERIAGKSGWQSEPRLVGANGRIYRPDVVTPHGRVLELKPNTPSGRASGARQIQIYEEQLGMRGRVIYYEPPQ
ncbi:MAG: hypothetical protein OJF58_000050 [Enhydrobacter sp.]|nr:MAG: hypothetical protein OJF58_000050 [Enhydrobacter sp.]